MFTEGVSSVSTLSQSEVKRAIEKHLETIKKLTLCVKNAIVTVTVFPGRACCSVAGSQWPRHS